MGIESGGYRPPSEGQNREKPADIDRGRKLSPEFLAAILAAMVAVCPSCGTTNKEFEVIPGNALVEKNEKKEKTRPNVYDIVRQEIHPENKFAFEAYLEDEALRHFQSKFSSPEDVRKNKNNYVLYSDKIESYLSSLENTKRRELIYETISKYCEKYEVPFPIAVAVMVNESGGRSGPVSSAGARGVFQVMPGTAAAMGISMDSLDGQVKAGIKALSEYYKKFGQWGLALAAFNGGSGDIAKFMIKHGHLEKKNFYKSTEKHFAGDQDEFYSGNRPDIVTLYSKSPNKQALGYVFRVIAMSRLLDAVRWDEKDEPLKIDKTKLMLPEFWDRKIDEEKDENKPGAKKPAGKNETEIKKRILKIKTKKKKIKNDYFASTWNRQRR